jgi:tRNA dimethylallyltransferase
MKHVVAIVGPTAVGKSALALKLALDFSGEIISADSRQVYRGLDIGTAKPSPQERQLVPHHLIDVVEPDQDFSLAQYQESAYKAIDDVISRRCLPLVVGGSGLYVWAVLEGWQIPKVAPDNSLRKKLEERAAAGEDQALYSELKQLNAEAAERIDPRNLRRVIRALEISQTRGDSKPAKCKPDFDSLIIGLTADRPTLYRRIDGRVDSMVESGLVSEVRGLLDRGCGLDLPAMSGIGYRQFGAYLTGKISLEEAIQQTKNETHRLVRMQNNWFSRKDDRIHWFNIEGDIYPAIQQLIRDFVKE